MTSQNKEMGKGRFQITATTVAAGQSEQYENARVLSEIVTGSSPAAAMR